MKKLYLLAIILFLIGCNENNNNELIPSENLSKLLKEFLEDHQICENRCVHEIYIDKQAPYYYQIILFQGSESLTKTENDYYGQQPIQKITFSGVEFNIFSGAEHYFNIIKPHNVNYAIVDSLPKINKPIHDKYWFVKDSFDILTVEKKTYTYPFRKLPDNHIPEIDLEKLKIIKND